MKLYTTPTSPFGLMAQIVIFEKGLTDRVQVIMAKTRTVDSHYYKINPSGRVPYLILEDGRGLEESQLICAYLDQMAGTPVLDHFPTPKSWDLWRLEALARSLLDSVSVWSRELKRAVNEQSPTIIAHETERVRRMLDVWEHEITNPLMNGSLNMAQLTLAVTLNIECRLRGFEVKQEHVHLRKWKKIIAARPSFSALLPCLYK